MISGIKVVILGGKVGERRIELTRKTVSGILLTLLFIGMLTLTCNIQPARAIGAIYIRADENIHPPTAPILNVEDEWFQ